MPIFVVINEQGPGWEDKRPMREQRDWTEHAAFMDALEEEGIVVLGGPLGNYHKHRAMLILRGSNEQDVRKRLAEDIWIRTGVLRSIEFYPWEILLGRLPEHL